MTRILARAAGSFAHLIVVGAFVTTAAPSLIAQGVTGTVSGTVVDTQGGVVPGVTVTLISETQNTRSAPVVTNSVGDFVFPNTAAPDTYTVLFEMPSFKTLQKAGVAVSPGSRVSTGRVTIEIGATSEIINVTSELPLVQASSGERSFSVTTESVTSLPLASRSYDALLALAPGVDSRPGSLVPANRLGGGGFNNFMVDGVSQIDSSINRPTAKISVESVAEVKVQTSGYAAEYGRSSGLQINAVTKSGTNQLHGSFYDVERDSRWNANSRRNILNGDPKTIVDERDWGFAVGGPVGKTGGNNKLFFYFNYERNPRTFNKDEIIRFRLPTAAERRGDFSQSRDNNGNIYNFIKDPALNGACNATSQVACFADGGVLGRIPAARLFGAGVNILNWFPEPNLPDTPGLNYNYETRYPGFETYGWQPVVRLDYQPTSSLRASLRFYGYFQPNDPVLGSLPGWSDTRQENMGIRIPGFTVNWTLNAQTFVEVSGGSNSNARTGGCSITGGAPTFCRNSGNALNDSANRVLSGMGDIPFIFPDATILEEATNPLYYGIAQRIQPTTWDGVRSHAAPTFAFGNRVGPQPTMSSIRINSVASQNINASVTRVQGSHTFKMGYYFGNSLTARGTGNLIHGTINFANDTSNPLDSTFGYSNAALGVFTSYTQQSRMHEGHYTGRTHEAYVQDNWRVTGNLTLDYGARLVHQIPMYDALGKSSNFLPDKYVRNDAPQLYLAGCAVATRPCPAASRQALNPVNNRLMGPDTYILVGALVPNTGNLLNGIFAAGEGIAETNYLYPALGIAPRVGAAWDIRGDQTLVLRGGGGLFFDRPASETTFNTVLNPPHMRTGVVRYGNLSNLTTGLVVDAAPALAILEYEQPLPASVQWNTGVQLALPFSTVLDVAYVGQHAYNLIQSDVAPDINSIDLGMAFLPEFQNPAVTNPAAPTNPTTSYVATHPDVVRFFKGYGGIQQQQPNWWRTYHSFQASVNRRFRNGLSFGFYDTISLYDRQNTSPRFQHNPDGTITVRADQARADELLGNNNPRGHLLRANFVWQLPKMSMEQGGATRILKLIANDWSLSGIWNGAAGAAYAVSASYQNGGGNANLTGSPDYAARVVLVPGEDLGGGCNDKDLLRQFNPAAFRGPSVGSDGLESGNGYLSGCFISSMDLAIARFIELGRGRRLQLRFDLFNAFNQQGITGRQTTMNLSSPSDPLTITNLPDPATGARTLPNGAGFGVANNFQAPRSAQVQIRFEY